MSAILLFMQAQPGWGWLALGAALLAGELATGSGYLLWPSASAGVVGLAALFGAPFSLEVQIGLFAVLTVATTYAARRWLPRRLLKRGDDINDTRLRLIGHEGEGVAGPPGYVGDGRVFIDGKEWAAELEGGGAPLPGQKVRVVAVMGGARLRVSPV